MLKLQLHKFLIKFSKIFLNFLILFFFIQVSAKADQDKMILGLKIFNEKGNCASCHQLTNAKSEGNIGPSLDDLKPTQAQVKQAVLGINIAKADHSSATPKATSEYIKWKNRNAVSFYVEKATK